MHREKRTPQCLLLAWDSEAGVMNGANHDGNTELFAAGLSYSLVHTSLYAMDNRPCLDDHILSAGPHPNLVTWDSPDDTENPLNWTVRKRWGTTVLVSFFMFVSPVSSSMVAPAFGNIASDLDFQSRAETQLVLSVFILGSAVGPLVISPMSEIYGRTVILQLTCLFYMIFNLACGFSQTRGQLVVFRLLSGIGGSAPALGGGLLADCWRAEERGRSFSLYYILPLVGPAIGPVAGAYITQNLGWRWMFYITSLLNAGIQIAGLIWLDETFAPTLLARKVKRLKIQTSNNELFTEFDHRDQRPYRVLAAALIRPCKLLGTQIIIQILAIYIAYIYGLLYLLLSTFFAVWIDKYKETFDSAGLNYISMGVGFLLGTQICAPLGDFMYKGLKLRNNDIGLPEFRSMLLLPSAILVPLGFLIYGWSAQFMLHWIVPNIGVALAAAGIITSMQAVTAYIIDAYGINAASAVAAITVLRSFAGFCFPLFAPYMYDRLQLGWGNSLLAFLAILLGWPAPFILTKYGAILRAKSPYIMTQAVQ